MGKEIATVYEGALEEDTPRVEDGVLFGENVLDEVEVDLTEGKYKLIPGYATSARETFVITVYEEE